MKKNKGYAMKFILIIAAIIFVYMRSSELNKTTIEISYKVNSGKETTRTEVEAAVEDKKDHESKDASEQVTDNKEKNSSETDNAKTNKNESERNINSEDKSSSKAETNDSGKVNETAASEGKEKKAETNKDASNEAKKPDADSSKAGSGEKIAYLTFDDGPTRTITPKILEILKKEDVKATFFVIGYMAEKNAELLKREKSEGHAIANHSYTHDYSQVYASPDSFLEEIKKADETIKSIVGKYEDKLIRLPGGSFKRKEFVEAAKEEGYHYVDWNCSSGDASGKKLDAAALVNNVIETAKDKNKLIILMHDSAGKETTAEALPEVINWLKQKGYKFKTLQ